MFYYKRDRKSKLKAQCFILGKFDDVAECSSHEALSACSANEMSPFPGVTSPCALGYQPVRLRVYPRGGCATVYECCWGFSPRGDGIRHKVGQAASLATPVSCLTQ